MTQSLDGEEESRSADFLLVSTKKKKNKRKHAETKACGSAILGEESHVTHVLDYRLPLNSKEHRKRKKRHRASQSESSEIVIDVLQSFSEPEHSYQKSLPTTGLDGKEQSCMIDTLNVGVKDQKKKKKSKEGESETCTEVVFHEDQYGTHILDYQPSLDDKEHRKRKKRRQDCQSQVSEEVLQIVHNISEPIHQKGWHGNGQAEKAGSVIAFSGTDTTSNSADSAVELTQISNGMHEDDGSREHSSRENDLEKGNGQGASKVRKHKKKKTHSKEKESGTVVSTENEVAEPLDEAFKTKKRHKKKKLKTRTAEGVGSSLEAGDGDPLNDLFISINASCIGLQETAEDGSGCRSEHPSEQNGSERDTVKWAHKSKQLINKERIGSLGEEDPSTETSENVLVTEHRKKRVKKKKRRDESVGEEPPLADSSADGSKDDTMQPKHKPKKSKLQTVPTEEEDATSAVSATELSKEPVKIKKKHRTTKEQDGVHVSRKSGKKKKVKEQTASGEHEMPQSVIDSEMWVDQGDLGQVQPSAGSGGLQEVISSEHMDTTMHDTALPNSLADEPEAPPITTAEGRTPVQKTPKGKKNKRKSGREEQPSAVEERLDVTLEEENAHTRPPDESQEAGDEEEEDWGSSREQEYEKSLCLLEELIPNIRSKNRNFINSLIRYDLQRLLCFREQGVAVRYGRFSAWENEQIKKNMAHYLEVTGIDLEDKVLHTYRYPEESQAVVRLKRQYPLGDYIGVGIPRPSALVQGRAMKMFDPYNYKGRYSKDEIEELKRHHATCGNSWNEISTRMARSNLSLALKFSQLRNSSNVGTWSKAERRRLVQAVMDLFIGSRSPEELEKMQSAVAESTTGEIPLLVREQLYKGISWVEVEAKVGTRNWMQCKLKWNTILTKRMTRGVKVYNGLSALQAKIRLIQRLYESQVEDSSELNWEELAKCIGDVPPAYAQMKFYKLKARNVPFWHTKTFPEIVDYLYEEKLPVFQNMLEKMKRKTAATETVQETQGAFRLTDIFQVSDGENSEPEDDALPPAGKDHTPNHSEQLVTTPAN
ncbi:transcription termination factor 1 isoform X2 [Ambystoma mexicanum]|uniref:transcription termination factor 1 isoform X2 n=1 Tax=Ambystoma mexicanum TaxID=8296 RepID=UPI0037E8672C